MTQPTVTIAVNYYGQEARLLELYEEWEDFPPEIRTMVVDDGSAVAAPFGVFPPDRMVQITRDIPFNMGGTINLMAALCDTPWLMHTDLDQRITPLEATVLVEFVKRAPRRAFFFDLRVEGDPTPRHNVSAWVMPLDLFWEIGGHDEDFAGAYGHEDVFFYEKAKMRGVADTAPFAIHHVGNAGSDIDRTVSERNRQLLYEKMATGAAVFDCNNPLRFPFRIRR